MEKEYYVVITSTFNLEIKLYKFNDKENAIAYIQYLWEDLFNNCDFLQEESCYHEEESGVLVFDEGNRTEINLLEGTDKIPEEFWKVKDSYMRRR